MSARAAAREVSRFAKSGNASSIPGGALSDSNQKTNAAKNNVWMAGRNVDDHGARNLADALNPFADSSIGLPPELRPDFKDNVASFTGHGNDEEAALAVAMTHGGQSEGASSSQGQSLASALPGFSNSQGVFKVRAAARLVAGGDTRGQIKGNRRITLRADVAAARTAANRAGIRSAPANKNIAVLAPT